jgi:hypothetical protein
VGVVAALGILRLLFERGRDFAALHFGGLFPADFAFLPVRVQLAALAAGILLGLIGSAIAVGRFLRS